MKLYTYSSETDVLEFSWDHEVERRVREEAGFDLFEDPEGNCIGVRVHGFSDKTGDIAGICNLVEDISDQDGREYAFELQYAFVHLKNMINSQRAFFTGDSHFGFVLQNWGDGEIAEGAAPPEPEDTTENP
jgi:hypothetical protein